MTKQRKSMARMTMMKRTTMTRKITQTNGMREKI